MSVDTFFYICLFLWCFASLKLFDNLFYTWAMKRITLCVNNDIT